MLVFSYGCFEVLKFINISIVCKFGSLFYKSVFFKFVWCDGLVLNCVDYVWVV